MYIFQRCNGTKVQHVRWIRKVMIEYVFFMGHRFSMNTRFPGMHKLNSLPVHVINHIFVT